METPNLRHRHALLLPVFLVALLVSALPAARSLPGSFQSTIISASLPEDQSVKLFKGIQILPGEDSEVIERNDQLVFTRGNVSLRSSGLFSILADDLRISGLDGALHLIISSNSLTVSALTTPVFVEQQDQRMVVPVGFRWEYELGSSLPDLTDGYNDWSAARKVAVLPQHFVEEHIKALPEEITEDLPEAAEAPEERSDAQFLLPGAEQIARETWEAQVLGALRHAIETDDAEMARAILMNPAYQETWSSEEGIRVRSLLLSKKKSLQMDLLSSLISQEQIWMLASLHPAYRDSAWTFGTLEFGTEAQLVRLLLFPHLDGVQESVNTFVFDRWSQAVKDAALHVEEPVDFLERFFHAHLLIVSRMRERGYPERAEMLQKHLQNLFEGQNVSLLTQETNQRLLDLQIGDSRAVKNEEPAQDAVEQIQKVAQVILAPEEVVRLTNTKLRESKALFTVKTSVESVAENTAKVEGVLYSGTSGDHLTSFMLDIVSGRVSEVVVDEKTYPFAPEFEEFVEWLKR